MISAAANWLRNRPAADSRYTSTSLRWDLAVRWLRSHGKRLLYRRTGQWLCSIASVAV